MKADPCDACFEELPRGAWTGIGGGSAAEPVLIVCRTCGPIVNAIDRLVDSGKLAAEAAPAKFEELRWRDADARGPRGSESGSPDVRDLRVRDLELSPLPEEPCFSI